MFPTLSERARKHILALANHRPWMDGLDIEFVVMLVYQESSAEGYARGYVEGINTIITPEP
jgi:hypothetical protein